MKFFAPQFVAAAGMGKACLLIQILQHGANIFEVQVWCSGAMLSFPFPLLPPPKLPILLLLGLSVCDALKCSVLKLLQST